jgi:pyruvate formate lyase activating enzyme
MSGMLEPDMRRGAGTGRRQITSRECAVCGRRTPFIARVLGVCGPCFRTHPQAALPHAHAAHRVSRRLFNLPEEPPHSPDGVACPFCARECRIGEGERGFCGLRTARDGRLISLAGSSGRGLLTWYRDDLPTNCVADWVCQGSRQHGLHNLAVFYESCTVDCLFCQNWHFRATTPTNRPPISAAKLAAAANDETFCVCFFGGDPASQIPHALATARRLVRRKIAICWETAGTSQSRYLDEAVELSQRSGGCIKFDLKAYDENLHVALTGFSNRQSLESFARAGRQFEPRRRTPLVIASTLMVPGYIDVAEVASIARFIAGIHTDIPYALLGFAPQFQAADLPRTTLALAARAEAAARRAGLTNVHIGNRHLLQPDLPPCD